MKLAHFLFLVGLCWVVTACQDDIDLEIKNQKSEILVVQAMLNNKPQTQYIRLTETTSYYENSGAKPAQNAQVIVTNNNNKQAYVFTELTKPDSLGYYKSPINFVINQGATYSLSINYKQNIYNSTSIAKPVPPIDSVNVLLNQIQFLFSSDLVPIGPEDTLFDIEVSFKELPQTGDYYLFNLYVNGQLFSDQPREKFVLNDEALSPYFKASIFTIAQYADLQPNDTVGVEILSVSQDLEEFYSIMFLQTDISGNPFGGSPPANVPTNIIGGARGIFQVSLVEYNETIFEK